MHYCLSIYPIILHTLDFDQHLRNSNIKSNDELMIFKIKTYVLGFTSYHVLRPSLKQISISRSSISMKNESSQNIVNYVLEQYMLL